MKPHSGDDSMDAGSAALAEALRIYLDHRRGGSGQDDAALLRRHPALRELLEPLLAQDSPARAGLQPGAVLGDFRLIEMIGMGGMGDVWEAEQISLQRRVALKLLRGQLFTNPRAVERFQREAQAGARLKHPGIVSVHSVGEVAGVHYIAQELVETRRTLSHVLRDMRELLSLPQDYWRESALLFARIAEALELAHSNGVIHRDVKPTNILIAADGTPKVADFGLALVAGASELSRSGDLSGSPFYMSPEQAQASRTAIDARSDVFSLGATLFEALTLQRPFDGDTIGQVLEKILFEDTRDPREIRSLCPAELAVTCLKMLEKNPAQRYADMAEVAAELRRFLNNEPILARPPGLISRATKWCRRHPVWASSGTIVCVSLVVLALLLVETLRARHAAEASAAAALRSAELARLESGTSSRVVDFLVGAFAEVAPMHSRGRDVTAREVLDRGVKNIRSGLADSRDAGLRARLLDSLGMVYSRLGLRDEAEELLREAKSLGEQAFGPADLRTLEICSELAILLTQNGRLDSALAEWERVHAGRVAALGNESVAALEAESNLGSALGRAGQVRAAEEHLRHALQGLQQQGQWSGPTMHSLAEVLRSSGQSDKAAALLRQTLDLYESAFGPDAPDTLDVLESVARQHIQNADLREALRVWREVAQLRDCVQGPAHPATIASKARALSLEAALDPEKHLIELRLQFALSMRELGPDNAVTLDLARILAGSLGRMQRHEEARDLYVLLLSNMAAAPVASPLNRAGMLMALAHSEHALNRPQPALSLSEEVLDLIDHEHLGQPQLIHVAMSETMQLREELGDLAGAKAQALSWLDHLPKDDPKRDSVEAEILRLDLQSEDH